MSLTAAVLLVLAGAAVAVLLLAAMAALRAAVSGRAFEHGWASATGDPLSFGTAEAAGIAVALAIGLRRYAPDARWQKALGVIPMSRAHVALAIVAGVALRFPSSELTNLLELVFPVSLEDKVRAVRMVTPESWRAAIAVVLGVVAIPALAEELLFRGLLLPRLAERHGWLVGLVASALVFGAIHWAAPASVPSAIIAGLVLGALALRARSILASIAMHAALVAAPLLVPARLVEIPGFNTVGRGVYHVPAPLVVGGAVVAMTAFALIARARQGSR